MPSRRRDLTPAENVRFRNLLDQALAADSQTELARKLKLKTPSTISSLKSGRQGASLSLAIALCQLRGVPQSAVLDPERIVDLADQEEATTDPKMRVRRSELYQRDAGPLARWYFDEDDSYTSGVKSDSLTFEFYVRSLLAFMDKERANALEDRRDKLLDGATREARVADPDAPPKKKRG